MSWVSGLRFRQVAAFHGRIGSELIKETENHASLLLELSNGGSATARLDYLRPETTPTHGDDRFGWPAPKEFLKLVAISLG